MNLENSLQDVARCHHCENPEPSLHCDICNKHVCEDCEKKHVSDRSNMHKLVPFAIRGCITICKLHFSQICDQFCEKCSIPICVVCASKKHKGHELSDVVVKLEQKRKDFKKDLEELKIIHPKFQFTL